jgi:hypothetical protein
MPENEQASCLRVSLLTGNVMSEAKDDLTTRLASWIASASKALAFRADSRARRSSLFPFDRVGVASLVWALLFLPIALALALVFS